MRGMVDLAELYDPPLDPAALDFTTKPGLQCRTCIFARQKSAVCDEAVRLALRADMASCDDEDVVYVLAKRDARQLRIDPVEE